MLEHEQKISLAIDGGHNIRPFLERCLKRAGFIFELRKNGNLHFVLQDDTLLGSITVNRSKDIPLRLNEGVNDFGMLGRDELREAQLEGMEIEEVEALGISVCRVVLEVPKESEYKHPGELAGARIATPFPNLTRAFFRDHNAEVRIVPYTGKTEGAPAVGAADAVVEIYVTGGAAEENDLRLLVPLDESNESVLLESEAVLASPTAFLRERGSDLIVNQFIARFNRTKQPRRSVNGHWPAEISPSVPQVA